VSLIQFVCVNAEGRVVQVGTCRPSELELQVPPAGGQVIEVPEGVGPVGPVGWQLVDGELVHAPDPVPIADLRQQALRRIDKAAELARLRFLTPGEGQSLEYRASEEDARRYVAAGCPTPLAQATYPFLWAEVAAQEAALGASPSPAAVAAEVISQAEAWIAAGAEIKRLRRTAKLAVAQAGTPAAIQAAEVVEWPEP